MGNRCFPEPPRSNGLFGECELYAPDLFKNTCQGLVAYGLSNHPVGKIHFVPHKGPRGTFCHAEQRDCVGKDRQRYIAQINDPGVTWSWALFGPIQCLFWACSEPVPM